jgi:CRISPR-associated protein Cas5d
MLKSVYWKPAIRYVIDKIVVFNPITYASIRRNEVKNKVELDTVNKLRTVCTKATTETVTNKVVLENVKTQMSGKDPTIYTSDCISQRTSLMLKNVKYGIEFHFELTNIHNEREDNGDAKHYESIKRRLKRGQCFRQPCMGCRELAVKNIMLVRRFDYSAVDSSLLNTQDLGYMLYGLKFNDDEKLKEVWSSQYFSENADAEYYHPFMVNGVIDVQRCRRGDYDIVKPV